MLGDGLDFLLFALATFLRRSTRRLRRLARIGAKVNLRVLAVLVLGGLLLGGGVYWLHGFQTRRHAKFFLQWAQTAKADGELDRAVGYLHRYLGVMPDDDDALAELGLLLAELSRHEQAYETLVRALRAQPDRMDVRRRLVDVAMRLGRYSHAREELQEHLLPASPDDGELLELLAVCQVAAGQYDGAADSLRSAIDSTPDRLDAYRHLAELLRRKLDRPREADQWMDRLAKANPDSPRAYVLRAGYLRRFGRAEEPAQEAAKALALAPDDVDALSLAARTALEKGQYDEARRHARRGIELSPKHAGMHRTLAEIEARSGRPDEAIARLRQGLEAAPGDRGLLRELAKLLIAEGRELEEAGKVLDQLRAAGHPAPLVGYLECCRKCRQGDWLGASRGFEQLRPDFASSPEVGKRVDYWLAKCYGRLGKPEQQLAACRRAVVADPVWVPARVELVGALLSAGRLDEALEEQRKIIKLDRASALGWVQLARLLLWKNGRLAASERDWGEAEKAVEQAARALPDSPVLPILQAEILVAQGRVREAERRLEEAREQKKDQVVYWLAQADLAQRQGAWERAGRLLDEARQKLGDSVPLRLARAQYLARRGGSDAARRLRELAEKSEQFSEADRLRLWGGLTAMSLRAGDLEQAGRLGHQIAKQEPDNLKVRLLLFELAFAAKDDSGMQRALKEIEQVEGKGPFWLYGEAVRLGWLAAQGEKGLLGQARKHLAKARTLRPKWSRIPLVAGEIDELEGNPQSAVENYLKAFDLGGRNPNAIRRLVHLLHQQQRYAEVDRLIARLGEEQAPFSGALERMASELSLREEDFDRALETAREGAAGSADFRDHLWLGQVQSVLGHRAKAEQQIEQSKEMFRGAEKSLRRAVELADKAPVTWVALIEFLARIGKTQQAEEAIQEARGRIPARWAPLPMAHCYEVLGKVAEAAAQYEAALAASPDDPVVVRRAVDFSVRTGKPRQAETQLRKIIGGQVPAAEAHIAWARRRLALILADRGGYQDLEQALELIEQSLATASPSAADRRAKAILLASHPKRQRRQEAITILERLLREERSAAPQDRFVLARLYLAEGDWAKARGHLQHLLASQGKDPQYVATYVAALLERKQAREAETWLRRLEEIAPEQFSTASLRAEQLVQLHGYDEAIAVLKRFLESSKARPSDREARLRLVASRLEQFAHLLAGADQDSPASQFAREAEAAWRQYVDRHPEEELLLAALLARQGRRDEALQHAEQTWQSAAPEAVAGTLAVLLSGGTATPEQLKRAERVLLDAIKKHNRPTPLLLVMADLHTFQERYREAEALYREILHQDSTHVRAMNNLAVLLALQRAQLDESLRLVQEAIEIAGPVSNLLDSRATVYLALGQPRQALGDLEEAIAETSSPIWHFHRAQAYDQLGQTSAATEALKQAQKLGLEPEQLHPLERPAYRRLQALGAALVPASRSDATPHSTAPARMAGGG